MKRIVKHLEFHVNTGIEFINAHGVEIVTDGIDHCIITCPHSSDASGSIDIWFDSVTAKQLINRFGIRHIHHLELLTPQHLQLIFDGQRFGALSINAASGIKHMECRWRNGQLYQYDINRFTRKVPYDPRNLNELLNYYADQHLLPIGYDE